MTGPDLSGALTSGRAGQQRRQRLAGDRAARPQMAASATRRPASARVMRKRSASTCGSLPPSSVESALLGELIATGAAGPASVESPAPAAPATPAAPGT